MVVYRIYSKRRSDAIEALSGIRDIGAKVLKRHGQADLVLKQIPHPKHR